MRRRWSISGPKAFSMRSAMSGVRADLPLRRSESVARRTCKISAAFDKLSPSASMTSVLIRLPGWGGFFMDISASSVVVDQVNIAGGIGIFVITEDQSPVSGYGHAPKSFEVTLERMQLPAGELAELFQRRSGFDGEEQLAQLVSHCRGQRTGVSVFVELPQALVAKPDQLHGASPIHHVRYYRTSQAPAVRPSAFGVGNERGLFPSLR